MFEPQQETVESPTPSVTGTVLGDQCQRIVDEEKDLFGKEVESYDDVVQSAATTGEIEAQLGVHPDGGFRAWLVCIGVNNFDLIAAISPSHSRLNSARQAYAQRLVSSTRGV